MPANIENRVMNSYHRLFDQSPNKMRGSYLQAVVLLAVTGSCSAFAFAPTAKHGRCDRFYPSVRILPSQCKTRSNRMAAGARVHTHSCFMSGGVPVPEHFVFRPDSPCVKGEKAELTDRLNSWASPAIEHTKHFDAEKLTKTGQWAFLSQGRARRFARQSSLEGEYSVCVVAESGAFPAKTKSKARADKTVQHEFTCRDDAGIEWLSTASPDAWPLGVGAQERTVVVRRTDCSEPGAAVCRFNMVPSASAVQEALAANPYFKYSITAHLWLAQNVGDVVDGYAQGVIVKYDAVTGNLVQLTRTDRRTLLATDEGKALATCCDPAQPIDFAALEAAAAPPVGQEAAYASYNLLGNPLADLVERACWTGRARVHALPDGIGGTEHVWDHESSISFASLCADQVRKGFYADLRFNDGVYLRLPYSLQSLSDGVVLEFGGTRKDKGIHRLIALASRACAGFHSFSYECFS